MHIYSICTTCYKTTRLSTKATHRLELELERGKQWSVRCSHCGVEEIKRVNDFKAEPDNKILLTGIGLSALVTWLLYAVYGLAGTITFIIPTLIWERQRRLAWNFNAFRIKN